MTDIAAKPASMLHIQVPNVCAGAMIEKQRVDSNTR